MSKNQMMPQEWGYIENRIIVIIFLLLILIFSLSPTLIIKIMAQSQLIDDRYEITATLEPPLNIKSGTTLTDLNFTVDYQITSISMFSEPTIINANQGLIGHWIEHQPTDVSINDNLGNSFSPIITDNSIQTPPISNISVSPFFEYRITLHFKTIDDVKFYDEINNFIMAYTESQTGIPVPMTVTFKIPQEYSIFQQTESSTNSLNQQYNVFTWNFNDRQNIHCQVVFMPYSIEPTVRSMGITAEFLSNSIKGALRETFTMTYDLIGTVMIWNLSLVLPIYVPFPSNMSGVEVESVSDGKGVCELRTSPINTSEIEPLGKYFVDGKNKLVTIYPRNTYQDITQKFDLEITFIVPNNISDNNINVDLPFWEPHKGFAGLFFDFQDSTFMHLNMTGNFKVTFIFSPEVDAFSSTDGDEFQEIHDNGKTLIVYNYNSPIALPKHSWILTFETIALRNFLNQQWLTIALFTLPFVALGTGLMLTRKNKLKKQNIAVFSLFDVIPTGYLTYRVIEDFTAYLTLQNLDWFYFLLIIVESLFAGLAIGLFIYIIWKKAEINLPTTGVNDDATDNENNSNTVDVDTKQVETKYVEL